MNSRGVKKGKKVKKQESEKRELLFAKIPALLTSIVDKFKSEKPRAIKKDEEHYNWTVDVDERR